MDSTWRRCVRGVRDVFRFQSAPFLLEILRVDRMNVVEPVTAISAGYIGMPRERLGWLGRSFPYRQNAVEAAKSRAAAAAVHFRLSFAFKFS